MLGNLLVYNARENGVAQILMKMNGRKGKT